VDRQHAHARPRWHGSAPRRHSDATTQAPTHAAAAGTWLRALRRLLPLDRCGGRRRRCFLALEGGRRRRRGRRRSVPRRRLGRAGCNAPTTRRPFPRPRLGRSSARSPQCSGLRAARALAVCGPFLRQLGRGLPGRRAAAALRNPELRLPDRPRALTVGCAGWERRRAVEGRLTAQWRLLALPLVWPRRRRVLQRRPAGLRLPARVAARCRGFLNTHHNAPEMQPAD
jgi:hypothetical protein